MLNHKFEEDVAYGAEYVVAATIAPTVVASSSMSNSFFILGKECSILIGFGISKRLAG